jgi:hypothetical protein
MRQFVRNLLDQSTFVIDLQDLLFGVERGLDILELESAAHLDLLTQNRNGSVGLDPADERNLSDRNGQWLLGQATVSG